MTLGAKLAIWVKSSVGGSALAMNCLPIVDCGSIASGCSVMGAKRIDCVHGSPSTVKAGRATVWAAVGALSVCARLTGLLIRKIAAARRTVGAMKFELMLLCIVIPTSPRTQEMEHNFGWGGFVSRR
jgi:hypothetical protein